MSLDDGVQSAAGAAGALAVGGHAGPWRLRGELGVTPAGLGAPPTWLGRLALGARVGRAELGVEGMRVPITDSLGSWGGAEAWGRAVEQAAGVWAGWSGEGVDIGARARVGEVVALTARTGRRRLDGWAGHRVGGARRHVRLGLMTTVLGHDTSLDAFGPEGAGAFTPRAWTYGAARADVRWGVGAGRICAGVTLGAQHQQGDASPFQASGTAAAAGARAGAALPLGRGWEAEVGARWEVAGEEWSEQVALVALRWPASPVGPASSLFGAAVEALPICP